jgi:hypothetical protein
MAAPCRSTFRASPAPAPRRRRPAPAPRIQFGLDQGRREEVVGRRDRQGQDVVPVARATSDPARATSTLVHGGDTPPRGPCGGAVASLLNAGEPGRGCPPVRCPPCPNDDHCRRARAAQRVAPVKTAPVDSPGPGPLSRQPARARPLGAVCGVRIARVQSDKTGNPPPRRTALEAALPMRLARSELALRAAPACASGLAAVDRGLARGWGLVPKF